MIGTLEEISKKMFEKKNKTSDLLKKTRIMFEITQKEMAEKTGLSLKTIRTIEKDFSSVSVENLSKYLNEFGFNLGNIIANSFDGFFVHNPEYLKKKKVVTVTNKGKKYDKKN